MPLQEAIRSTGIGTIEADDIKFSYAVRVESYEVPFVCTMWIYIAASYIAPASASAL